MFTSVLVANRGEIAVRICKTLRSMGIRSVVVASIPDRRSMAVRHADEWELLEGYSAAESYLDANAVIAAAKKHGCEAIHPGYGFLSERADFAERCAAEGIVFVGPPPAVLAGMGDKAAARKLAVANGVPVVPGWDGTDDDDTLLREAAKIGFPIMVKARGGGGGRGMREVTEGEELLEAISSARREAEAAFGDGSLLLEKLVTKAHHVEVQVLADAHGNVVHLGERDCSVQRRHQKLIEETPSPVVDDALRAELTGAALRLARAIGYVNAGTFEFLVAEPGPDGRRPFYFLEVNPRLQVEHPVTEMVTGLDLVELQLRIAAGEPLPFTQDEVKFEGHAIEFRINAEDPWDGFKPSSGRISKLRRSIAGARTDTGYESLDVVPGQYDSLVAKVIVDRETREAALSSAVYNLRETAVEPISTNERLLLEIVRSEDFRAGLCTVDWLDRELRSMIQAATAPLEVWMAVAAVTLAEGAAGQVGPRSLWLSDRRETRTVAVSFSSANAGIAGADAVEHSFSLLSLRRKSVGRVEADVVVGEEHIVYWRDQEPRFAEVRGRRHVFDLVPPPPLPRRPRAATEGATAVTAPLAGTIASVRVAEGDAVEAGQVLLTLDAMKMEHRVLAPSSGIVKTLVVKVGDVVHERDVLAELGS